ncbi:tetratricopeptide repeat protein [Ruegeria denitrificans]|uniref:Tetratricopeptide repeat protein n=1 Tax=Ruegeria denitrificans TaxID=1715692 RepID=A0A0P1I043_9RHOB|nr:adenylate/guanylate cyclase domain-containing protein [Ruegeria denitrificans]CUJ82599.1 tetratricopeptide repeat protein [Ruegeria denitrificans]
MTRRLAAILFYDVVGFSRAMGKNEASTLDALKKNHDKIIAPFARSRGGRMIKAMGDGGFMEFSSAVDAVRFSVSMQYAVSKANQKLPEQQRLIYRIGINIGDVVADGSDIFGDGVNIASRLEGLAQPGGICVHQSVRDQIGGNLDIDFSDLGEKKLKNIDHPVHAFSIVMNQKAGAVAKKPARDAAGERRISIAGRLAVGAVACLLVIIAAFWWKPWVHDVTPASVERMAFPLPDKPSLAVLPFTDMSKNQGQEHFADGMTEDLITDLSRISGLFIVARNSTFVYKGRSVNIARVAEDLGVRFVLEGSVRRIDDQVRVNAQLIDATTGGHVWADRFDGDTRDIFAAQDEFIRKIAKAMAVNLTEEEMQEIALGQTTDLSAREVFQDGWESYLRYSANDNAKAVDRFKKALEIDPEYGRAHAALSLAYLRGCQQRWNEALGMSAGEANIKAQSALAETRSRPSSLANVAASRVHLYNERYDIAQVEATKAIARDPNDPEGYVAMAWAMITTNQPEAGLDLMDRAIRQNPAYPNYYILALAMAYYTLGDLEKTADILTNALEQDPKASELAAVAASVYAQLGRQEEAHAAMKSWMPGASSEELSAAPYMYHFPYNWRQGPETVDKIVDGLHLAALPPGDPLGSLVRDLKAGDKASRIKAARMLGKFGPRASSAVPALIEALQDEVMAVRKEVVISLGKIGPDAEAAVPYLSSMTEQRIVGRRAIKALVQITGE